MIVRPQKILESKLLKINKINSLSEVKDSTIQYRAKRAKSGWSQEYVARVEEAEAAFLSFEYGSDKSSGFIYEIFVLPDFRKQGIGTELLSYAESLAIDLNCSVVRLEPYALDELVNLEFLVSWYRKKGYEYMTNDTEKMEKTLSKK